MLRATFDKHNAPVLHFDISSDSQYIRSNCGAFETLYCDATTGAYIPGASALRDVDWETHTCTMTWGTQGIWSSLEDGSDCTTLDCSKSREALAVGDNFGRIRLMRFPAPSKVAIDKTIRGHRGVVQRLRWTAGDTHVLSVGGDDRYVRTTTRQRVSVDG